MSETPITATAEDVTFDPIVEDEDGEKPQPAPADGEDDNEDETAGETPAEDGGQ